MLIFNVPQHIPRRKQTSETLRKSISSQTILYHFETLLSMSFHPFSENFLWFIFSYNLFWKFSLFDVLLFVKKPKNNFGWEYKKGIHMYCEGLVLNHYDYWPILGQSTTTTYLFIFLSFFLFSKTNYVKKQRQIQSI